MLPYSIIECTIPEDQGVTLKYLYANKKKKKKKKKKKLYLLSLCSKNVGVAQTMQQ